MLTAMVSRVLLAKTMMMLLHGSVIYCENMQCIIANEPTGEITMQLPVKG